MNNSIYISKLSGITIPEKQWKLMTSEEKIEYETRYSFNLGVNLGIISNFILTTAVVMMSYAVLILQQPENLQDLATIGNSLALLIKAIWIVVLSMISIELVTTLWRFYKLLNWKKTLNLKDREDDK